MGFTFVKMSCEITYDDGTKVVKDEICGFEKDKELDWMLDKRHLRKVIFDDFKREGAKKLKILSAEFCDNPMNNRK